MVGPNPHPDLRISWLLHASEFNYPSQDMGFKVHNGESAYFHPDLVSPCSFSRDLSLPETMLSASQILPIKDLHD